MHIDDIVAFGTKIDRIGYGVLAINAPVIQFLMLNSFYCSVWPK